jgi:hypothetical protein
MADHSFAEVISGATPAELIILERATGRGERFADVDRILASLLASALSGARILEFTTDETDPEKRDIEGYAKLSLKKYRPIAARNEDEKVFNGRL